MFSEWKAALSLQKIEGGFSQFEEEA